LEKIRNDSDHSKNHEMKIMWHKGESRLFIDGALVDIYPKRMGNSKSDVDSSENQNKINESVLFDSISNVDPNKGSIVFTVSKLDWLENNGKLITIVPHIITDNFEVHAYRGQDFSFKFLISNAFSEKVILGYNDLSKLKNNQGHPKHKIGVTWDNGENRLYIDGELLDSYKVNPQETLESGKN
jgi:hypothetical protein